MLNLCRNVTDHESNCKLAGCEADDNSHAFFMNTRCKCGWVYWRTRECPSWMGGMARNARGMSFTFSEGSLACVSGFHATRVTGWWDWIRYECGRRLIDVGIGGRSTTGRSDTVGRCSHSNDTVYNSMWNVYQVFLEFSQVNILTNTKNR